MSSIETTRRLSPWRVGIALLALGGLGTAAVFGMQSWAANATAEPDEPWFAAYVDVTATPHYAFETPADPTAPDVMLSFVVASPTADCEPSWGAAYTLDEASSALDLDRRIARLQQNGGAVAVSFGGQANDELALTCTDTSDLEKAYADVVERYGTGTIDLDIEGDALRDRAANIRRATAIADLQSARRAAGEPLAVWLTLPVAPGGMTEDATTTIAEFLAADVDLAGVNLMTMNYGASLEDGVTMVDAAESALSEARRQLGALYTRAGQSISDRDLRSKIGATPMIGQNDVSDEVFTIADAEELNAWALEEKLGRVSMWSANRDQECGSNYVATAIVSDACSGVSQDGDTFTAVLSAGFTGSLALDEHLITTPEPTTAAEAVDDPATSPYPIWAADGSYVTGAKVVWHRNVYEAKWWTRGDLPDNPVLNSWETPWQLIGPVMPGETPVPQAVLPAGTYPDWSGTVAYQKRDRVLFGGVPFEAKWWTQGDSPEASAADADSSPWVALTQKQIDVLMAPAADPTPVP
ncbi:chitinase [Agromyces atrinae]|uniref:Chitinase n=1 Tax=Agromyces atrinae TaxID=592376 RepID=A0A4Q2M9J6_9MICO|nr:chitinase [Agromyces atrinae]NYD66399.1 chitinase [Agromyces atrinae]RXZ86711.1 glycosyl hydrolase family 18 [Agromyces atrinae]